MNIDNTILQKCVNVGIKLTEQRKVIAEVISKASDHPNVEEIHRRAAQIDNNISIATVYRTVSLFEELGVIAKHEFHDGKARYELAPDEPHYHLIDIKSGEVFDFRSKELDEIKDIIAKKLGYKIVDYRLEVYGIPLKDEKNG